eukprot:1344996-Amphidinium_carterae.1
MAATYTAFNTSCWYVGKAKLLRDRGKPGLPVSASTSDVLFDRISLAADSVLIAAPNCNVLDEGVDRVARHKLPLSVLSDAIPKRRRPPKWLRTCRDPCASVWSGKFVHHQLDKPLHLLAGGAENLRLPLVRYIGKFSGSL